MQQIADYKKGAKNKAWLLLHSEYTKHNEKLGRMAAPPLSDVYLEAVEAAENENEEFDEARTSEVACL